MKKEIKFAFEKFEKVLGKLKQGADTARAELESDGVIQRFEFTFELLWKTVKIILEDQGIAAHTPKMIMQEAFRLGWISDEQIFLNMLEDRNLTSHIYNESTAKEIFERIKNDYIGRIEELFDTLKSHAE